MITDLTEGKVGRRILSFSVPMLLSVIFQQMYTLADFIIAGKYLGIDELAAVGVSGMVTFLFLAFATGSNIGASVVISKHFGAKEYGKMKTAISTSVIAVVSLAVFFTVVGRLTSAGILEMMNTAENIATHAEIYLNIYIYGLIFLFLYNICNGVYSALGDSRTPFVFLVISSLSNIALDYYLVVERGMGVDGVAWATFICQGVASTLSAVTLVIRLIHFKADEKGVIFSLPMLGEIGRLAVPSILQQSFVSVGNIMIMSKVNTFDTAFVAAYGSCIKLNTFIINCCMAISNAVSSFTAQNIGAGKVNRVKYGFRYGLLFAECVAVLFIVLFMLFPDSVISIFLDTSKPEIIQDAILAGRDYIYIVSPAFLVMVLKVSCDAVLRGAGAMTEFMLGTFSSLFIRVIFSFLLGNWIGEIGIWIALPLGWIFPCLMSYYFYKKGTWKRKINRPLIEEQTV